MWIEVLETDGFDSESHEGSSEEHAQGVLKGKGSLKLGLGVMFLQVGEVVQGETHDELVETDD